MAKQGRDAEGKFKVVHGSRSLGVRKRFGDKRTREGKELEQVMGAIVADFGGLDTLNGHQTGLLMVVQEKLMVVLPVKRWLEQQLGKIVREGDKLAPVLEKSYLAWLNGLERSLDRLYATLATNKPPLTLEEYLQAKTEAKDER